MRAFHSLTAAEIVKKIGVPDLSRRVAVKSCLGRRVEQLEATVCAWVHVSPVGSTKASAVEAFA